MKLNPQPTSNILFKKKTLLWYGLAVHGIKLTALFQLNLISNFTFSIHGLFFLSGGFIRWSLFWLSEMYVIILMENKCFVIIHKSHKQSDFILYFTQRQTTQKYSWNKKSNSQICLLWMCYQSALTKLYRNEIILSFIIFKLINR